MHKNLKEILLPYLTPYTKKRYGLNHDGGYIFLSEPFQESNIVYSYGIGDTAEAICFDLECSRLGKEIYMYDASIDFPSLMARGFHFKKEFLNKDNFQSHIIENSHSLETSMTLKMDIEGSEYSCIIDNIELVNKHFNQVSIECHNLSQYPKSNIQQEFFSKMLEYYNIVHIHGNNYDFVHEGIPNCLELTFLRKNYIFDSLEKEPYPDPVLDFPNDPNKPDIQLDWWIK